MCDCIRLTNEALKKEGLQLIIGFKMDGHFTSFTPIQTEKIDHYDRKVKVAKIQPSFCPFCGEKQ